MADNSSGGEKSEYPTPKKIRDARDEGQVAFSSEINTVAVLLVGTLGLGVVGPWLWRAFEHAIKRMLQDQLMWEITDLSDVLRMGAAYIPLGVVLGMFLAATATTGVAISLAQVGLHVSGKALIPKFSRLNPISGLSRIFGLRGLVRTGLGLVKLCLIASVAFYVIEGDLARQLTVDGRMMTRLAAECNALYWLAIKLVLVLLVVASLDAIYQRWQHTKDLMMTKQEVKEEFKQSEGDPLIKSKIRQIQREIAQRRMMQEVPKADVVITNPTHVAVALRYDKATMNAPIVVAKGYDAVAQRIKALAAEHNIPMIENVPLARALAKEVDMGRAVPTKWYEAVAEILAMVYRLKNPKGAQGSKNAQNRPGGSK